MAESILRQDRTEEALAMLRQSEARVIALSGEQSIDLVATRVLIGIALARQGQLDAAQAAFQFGYDHALRLLGPEHYLTMSSAIYLQLLHAMKSDLPSPPPPVLLANFGWQASAPALAQWFEQPVRRQAMKQLPVVF
jgi:hypothetical protein